MMTTKPNLSADLTSQAWEATTASEQAAADNKPEEPAAAMPGAEMPAAGKAAKLHRASSREEEPSLPEDDA